MTEAISTTSLPELGTFKGRPVLILDAAGCYPFIFGLSKANLLIKPENLKALRVFVATNGKAITEPE